MRKHRLFGVVIAVTLGSGLVTQHPSTASAVSGGSSSTDIELAAVQKLARGHETSAQPVHSEAFTFASGDAAGADTLLALSAYMKPPPKPAPAAKPVYRAPAYSGDAWLALRRCESGDDYTENSGNGYYGAYQFSESTWASLGFSGLPSAAAPELQDQAAHELQARRGWAQWPGCARRLGLY